MAILNRLRMTAPDPMLVPPHSALHPLLPDRPLSLPIPAVPAVLREFAVTVVHMGRIVRDVSKCVKLHLRGRGPAECDGGGGDKHHYRQSHVPHLSFESDQLYIDPTELSTSRLFFRPLSSTLAKI